MTIKKRLARSNIAMFVIPVLAAAVVLALGLGAAVVLLDRVYLPRLGVTLHVLHQTGEQLEGLLSGFKVFLCIYAGAVVAALLLTIALTALIAFSRLYLYVHFPSDILGAVVLGLGIGTLMFRWGGRLLAQLSAARKAHRP